MFGDSLVQTLVVLCAGIAIGKDGNIFVVDGRRIRQIGSDDIIVNYLGSNRRMGRNLQKRES